MYAADNGNRVVNGYGIAQTEQDVQSGALDNWANNIMTWGASASLDDQSNTNVTWVVNGVLGKYLSDPVRVYKCPADTFLSARQVAAGWQARLRSISMNSFFGRFSASSDPTAQGLNWAFSQYLQYLKTSSVLKPAKTWVVLDEHPDSINDGVFINDPGGSYWGDIPASYHSGGCGFGFADGHSEVRKWQSQISIPPVRYAYSPGPFDALGRIDFAWYLEHTGYVNVSTGLPAFNY
jgi:prepilin-type processing-associated H-X9-DG protein